jgi:hypothetical protein
MSRPDPQQGGLRTHPCQCEACLRLSQGARRHSPRGDAPARHPGRGYTAQFIQPDPSDTADLAINTIRSNSDRLVAPILIIRLARWTSTVRALICRS